jgi:hypothetical protein
MPIEVLGIKRRLAHSPSQVVRSFLDMPTKANKPGLVDWECLLTVNRLQTQAARSVALDGGALGVMAVGAAVAAIVLELTGVQ